MLELEFGLEQFLDKMTAPNYISSLLIVLSDEELLPLSLLQLLLEPE